MPQDSETSPFPFPPSFLYILLPGTVKPLDSTVKHPRHKKKPLHKPTALHFHNFIVHTYQSVILYSP
nr:MAG TPA: hypothetical protein [Caudoviricetes sp.]